MIDNGPSQDDISQLWGEKPALLVPAPLRPPDPAQPAPPAEPEDAMAVLQGELRRLQALVAALDPASLRRETSTALETGLAALESRLGTRLDELTRRVDALAATSAVPRPGASAAPPQPIDPPTARPWSWRSRRELEETTGPAPARTTAAAPAAPPANPDPAAPAAAGGGPETPATAVAARLGTRLDELGDLVEGLVRRLPGRSGPADPPANGRRPVEGARSPIV